MSTALELCTDALTEIAVLGEGQTASAAQAAHSFRRLNQYLNTCAADNLTIPAVTRTTATLTANQSSFTVGPGGNINIARPVFIERVNYIDTSPTLPTEYQLPALLTEDAWQQIVLKTMPGVFPQVAYYSPTFTSGFGTLYPWPIPTSTTLQWVIYHWTAIVEFATLGTTVTLPPAYEEMLVTNLALLLAPAYEKQPHPLLIKRATDTMANVKRANGRLLDLSFPPESLIGARRRSMSIYTG